MMNWKLNSLGVLLLMAATSCVSHRETTTELAKRLMVLQREQEIFDSYRSIRSTSLAGATDHTLQDRFEAEFTWQKVEPHFLTIYTNTYSPDELRALVDFYSSPTGKVRNDRWKQTRDKMSVFLEQQRRELITETKESRTSKRTVP